MQQVPGLILQAQPEAEVADGDAPAAQDAAASDGDQAGARQADGDLADASQP
jgi:hypothetical protein